MLNHYKDLGQISSRLSPKDDYTPPVFDFGESTTDPSFYEPIQSQIANMRNMATSGEGIFDFEDGEKIPDDIIAPIGRKPGMTHEEMSNIKTKVEQSIKAQANNTKSEIEAEAKYQENLKKTFDNLTKTPDLNQSPNLDNNKK